MITCCFRLSLFLTVCALCLTGCSESPPSSGPPPGRPSSAAPPNGGLSFTAPVEWIQETPSSSMRIAQYRLPGTDQDGDEAELAVFHFQGQGGSVQANMDRWIGQFFKADGSPANDIAQVSEEDSNGIHLTTLDVSGTYKSSMGPMMAATTSKPNHRMMAAIAEGPGGPWFFKLTGPESTVGHWEESFHQFLETLQLTP